MLLYLAVPVAVAVAAEGKPEGRVAGLGVGRRRRDLVGLRVRHECGACAGSTAAAARLERDHPRGLQREAVAS